MSSVIKQAPQHKAKFVEGDILKHILVMSSTAAIGISALFIVELIDILFLSMLERTELIAAIGYAGVISYFTISIGIGLSIAIGALVSRSIGMQDLDKAKRLLANGLMVNFLVSTFAGIVVSIYIPELLSLVGAEGETADLAESYAYILLPTLPVICLGMALGSAIRAIGNARLAMYTTLIGAIVNLTFDPIFIFVLDLDIRGAAIASVLSRLAVLAFGAYVVFVKYNFRYKLKLSQFRLDLPVVFAIAIPAIFTNMATPLGNAIVTHYVAAFGDDFMSGWAVIGRIVPVAFGMIYALSGAIGPIVGQNYGAQKSERLKETLVRSVQFCFVYVAIIALVLFMLKGWLVHLFSLEGNAADIFLFFCCYMAIFFGSNGTLFISNAVFNNLGKAKYSTFFNMGKATLGTIPFVYIGAEYGIYGVLIGRMIGNFIFGFSSVIVAYKLICNIAKSIENRAVKGIYPK